MDNKIFYFHFPSHLCPRDSFGYPVDWVVFQYVKGKKIMPCDIRYDRKDSKLLYGESIVWATSTQNQIFTGAILAQNLSNAGVVRDKQPFVEEVEATSLAIGNLLLHSLNAGANPERKLIEAKGFTKNQHKANEKEPTFLNPKWIGREVKVYHRETARLLYNYRIVQH
ncbi:hypothetical protein CAL7716_011480 [Calothrix sp. PCC 7716]|nr:hypothetical protein CAL7716_011480 [Calothrix sp. PCC 7716]